MKILLTMMMVVILMAGCQASGETIEPIEETVDTVTAASEEVENETDIVESNFSHDDNAAVRYFRAVVESDLEGFLSAFSEDAVIRVVSRELTDDEIIGFALNEVFGGVYEIYRAEMTEGGIRILLQFTPEGWDSPEPMAVYDFTIVDDLIVSANLQYASNDDKEYFRDKYLNNTSLISSGFREYLRGVSEDDAKVLVSGFTDGAEVRDVSRDIVGKDNIERWANNEVLFLEYEVMKMMFTSDGEILFNHILLNESRGFYGSYDMVTNDGLIKYANLQYSSEDEMTY